MTSPIASIVRRPTVRQYLTARETILGSYSANLRHSEVLFSLESLFQSGNWRGLRDQATAIWPAWQLSPRVNFLLGIAAQELGKQQESDTYRRQMQTLLRLLLDTGEGNAPCPFQITYVSDERDILRALGVAGVRQELICQPAACERAASSDAGRSAGQSATAVSSVCDVIYGDDGEAYWFEVTQLPRAAQAIPHQVLSTAFPHN